MGDKLFENSLTDEINRICYQLDISILSPRARAQLIARLQKLVTHRDRIRRVFDNDPAADSDQ